jgi:hyperosmotically inducible periplasmic protein
MKPLMVSLTVVVLLSLGVFAVCLGGSTKLPAVTSGIRASLDQFGYKEVSVTQDRTKGVVTLTGRVSAEPDKEQAESIARSMASGQIVSDEIVIVPGGDGKNVSAANADLDKGIAMNVGAALIQNKVMQNVSYRVKSGVVTLKGSVSSRLRNAQVEEIVSSVPNVKQVVNKLQVNEQGASSSN